ncbi:sensor histidine kinase [Mycolicibacterium aubagnense]|uniref:histidine kinase n=1 Tax=Mycolicibacterium aubagnense TaxID=319707 RepID=A0ABM7IDM0_9MYCO|nr:ATP-binding protein [Mycolicibacterium aubagnense]TLH50281.1 ATP-binding protein [Mycolicibacterium aubagnense]WGI33529.1 ATP-binding protein [Mycolicibacterium aubagnense]BBX84735.1 putative two component sensor kinase [Mycolicibacterium aubagnense]
MPERSGSPGSAPVADVSLLRGLLLQFALRALLAVFIGSGLLLQPPNANRWLHWGILAGYGASVTVWGLWAQRSADRSDQRTQRAVSLLMLCADLTVVAIISADTGLSSPETWTSDVLQHGLFLIPLIAAAQLDPVVSAMIAIPTVGTFFVVNWIDREANGHEPWGSILLRTAIVFGLAAGSVALSWIQQSKTRTITDLALERTRLLEEVISLEKRERQSLSERLHDGALQYVLVARHDMEDVRDGSVEGMDRVDFALAESSRLLRDVVRELHPEVLARAGLKAAITALADSIAARTSIAVQLDADGWPDNLRTDADYLLYSAAREFSTNAIKHAHADNLRFTLAHNGNRAELRITDDGVGIPPNRLAQSIENGHIGFASICTKVLATGGEFAVTGSPGTVISIAVPTSRA